MNQWPGWVLQQYWWVMRKNRLKSQSFVEYAVLICVLVGALVAMKIHMARAVQEKYRQSADVMGDGEQYVKGKTQITNLDGQNSDITPSSARGPETCPGIVGRVEALEADIKDLTERADTFESSANETESQLPQIIAQAEAFTASALQKENRAKSLREQAVGLIADADAKQQQIDQYKKDYAYCFMGYDEGTNCSEIVSTVTNLETEVQNLRSQADSLNSQAGGLENDAAVLRKQAADLNDSVAKLREQVANLRKLAGDFRNQIDEKTNQINQYKAGYGKCFQG